jgi:hypothetical protein
MGLIYKWLRKERRRSSGGLALVNMVMSISVNTTYRELLAGQLTAS